MSKNKNAASGKNSRQENGTDKSKLANSDSEVNGSLLELLDRPIAFHRVFVRFGGVTVALLLSQALYWQRRSDTSNSKLRGYWHKTQMQWEDEIGLSRFELETAREKAKKLGILDWRNKGVPARTHYRLRMERLLAVLQAAPPAKNGTASSLRKTRKLACRKPANKVAGKSQRISESSLRLRAETPDLTRSPSAQRDLVRSKFEHVSPSGLVIKGAEFEIPTRKKFEAYLDHEYAKNCSPAILERDFYTHKDLQTGRVRCWPKWIDSLPALIHLLDRQAAVSHFGKRGDR